MHSSNEPGQLSQWPRHDNSTINIVTGIRVIRSHHPYYVLCTHTMQSNVTGWSVTLVSPEKTAEPIEMLFGLRTRVGQGNHVLDGGPDPPRKRAILGKGGANCEV